MNKADRHLADETIARADALLAREQTAAAITLLHDGFKSHGKRVVGMRLAAVAFKASDHELVVKTLRRVVETHPRATRAHMLLARSLEKTGHLDECAQHIATARELGGPAASLDGLSSRVGEQIALRKFTALVQRRGANIGAPVESDDLARVAAALQGHPDTVADDASLAEAFAAHGKRRFAAQLSKMAFDDRDHLLAIATLRSALTAFPDMLGPHILLARSLETTEQFEQALGVVAAAEKLGGNAEQLQSIRERVQERIDERDFTALVKRRVVDIDAAVQRNDMEALAAACADLTPHRDRLAASKWFDEIHLAKAAHFVFARDCDTALRAYDHEILEVSVECGYLTWPRRIQRYIQHKSVLDVGCGFGGYGSGFLAAGASRYAGVDPAMDLDSLNARNKRTRTVTTLPLSPRDIALRNPSIDLYQGKFEDVVVNQTFDIVSMHNVTEHLMAIDEVFGGVPVVMHTGSQLVYLHHHYYGWNGHHMQPVTAERYDANIPEQRLHADWNHVINEASLPADSYVKRGLNQISLDELREVTERHFKILRWDERLCPQAALARLTPEIAERALQARPGISKHDLEVHTVFCVAELK